MNLLERYIFKKAGIATLVVLFSLAGVVWIVQALGRIDIITTKGQSLVAYFMMTTLVIPMLFLAVIPVALLLATVYTINTLNANSELVVINTSGASNRLVTKPFLVLALLCSLFTGFVGHFVVSWSLTELKRYTTEMKADLVTAVLREGEFNEVEKGMTFHVAKRSANGRLNGILISDDRKEGESLLYLAREGIVSRDSGHAFLYLLDGEIHQRDARDQSASIIRYDSYIFDLDSLAPKTGALTRRPKERTTWELLFPNPDDAYLKKRPELIASAIHQRFSEMLWPIAYVMVILAFCGQARSSRQGYGNAIACGMILLFALRGLAFSAASSIKANESAAILLYLLPLAAIAYSGSYLYQNRLIGVPRALKPLLDQASITTEAWRENVRQRYVGMRRRLAGAGA